MAKFTSNLPAQKPVIAVDLGYSARRSSCGVASSVNQDGKEMGFGDAIRHTSELLTNNPESVLVLEAVLSTYHQQNGNPGIRGDFENGRGWYYGAGVLSFAAAIRFLDVLSDLMDQDGLIPVAEAFLSNKDRPTGHAEDAKNIRDNFWNLPAAIVNAGAKPASPLIDGVPVVKVFTANM